MSDNKSSAAKFSPAPRRKARHYGMQALYQWHMTKNPLNEIDAQFQADYDFTKVDTEYFSELVHQVPACVNELDATFTEFLQGRTFDELDPVELALLRLGSYELVKRVDIPYKVAISEAVTLAKKFGASEGHKYINAVLDQLAKKVRHFEVQASNKGPGK